MADMIPLVLMIALMGGVAWVGRFTPRWAWVTAFHRVFLLGGHAPGFRWGLYSVGWGCVGLVFSCVLAWGLRRIHPTAC